MQEKQLHDTRRLSMLSMLSNGILKETCMGVFSFHIYASIEYLYKEIKRRIQWLMILFDFNIFHFLYKEQTSKTENSLDEKEK